MSISVLSNLFVIALKKSAETLWNLLSIAPPYEDRRVLRKLPDTRKPSLTTFEYS